LGRCTPNNYDNTNCDCVPAVSILLFFCPLYPTVLDFSWAQKKHTTAM
jgi:hypothetical protein